MNTDALFEYIKTLESRIDNISDGISWEDIYPVGAIYISTVSTSPATLFGGSWSQIKDTFLLSAGDNYSAGTTGGSSDAIVPYHRHSIDVTSDAGTAHSHGKGTLSGSTPTLTANNSNYIRSATGVGSLNRTLGSAGTSGGTYAYLHVVESGKSLGKGAPTIDSGKTVTISGSTGNESAHTHDVNGNTAYVGTSGNVDEANMPPYLTVYVWKRTA